jgi:rhodanese-related sulfurtransferase
MYREIGSVITVGFVCVAIVSRWLVVKKRERRAAELEQHTITPEQLSKALAQRPGLPVFDLRERLDVQADSEIIPGATRISLYKVLENPWLIPKEQEAIIYCKCSKDEINIVILERLLAVGFFKVRFLKGGFDAWKAGGFKVDCYPSSFRLDLAS